MAVFRFMVAGGGTGGHVFPGIAVADALARRVRDLDVCWVGTEKGIEARILPTTPWRFEPMVLSGLNGVRGRALLAALGKLPPAGLQAFKLVRAFRPHAVLGVGGYAGGPMVALAAAMRVPTAVLEPNAIPGLTNRLLSRVVRRAFVTHDETQGAFPRGVAMVTGSPVRRAFLTRIGGFMMGTAAPVTAPSLLVLGGSQGARAINEVMPDTVAALRARGLACKVIHQTGTASRDAVAAAYAARGLDVEVRAFIDDVASVMEAASLVICRAGAMTVAELGVLGKPAIYIPLPTAADDHQRKNAEAMEARGAARCLAQSALTAERLAEMAAEIIGDTEKLRAMGDAAWRSARPDAAGVIADELLTLSGWDDQS
ncbi:MAG: undecaprenyldiphospho-muramoylpentapeptide beta-N-acetylglucosaminyltransferase [Myxococcales bacterium]|nr:undecaprenyldiphospho-muramoylpentapeptide beta-N-acetylglucosaminyltransferase [Myxococcales bacterium]